MNFIPLIGLEIHAELATQSKLFCSCPVAFAHQPNDLTCPVCLGLPGSLPVLNRRAVELAVRAILALGGEVNPLSSFARKNYFYPDTPKGYQITQHQYPLGWGGKVLVEGETHRQKVGIRRIHLEEDAAKLVHEGAGDGPLEQAQATLVDYNRSGVPLIEIVSEAEMETPEMAQGFLEEVKQILQYTGVSHGRMEQGSLRVDCNISLRPEASLSWGQRVELKNLASSRSLVRALHDEIKRQEGLLRAQEPVLPETRHWDERREISVALRGKETESEYRYLPEADLPPLLLERSWIAQIEANLPQLPGARRRRLTEQYGLSRYAARVLADSRSLADFYEETVANDVDAKLAANWIMGELMHQVKERRTTFCQLPFAPAALARLLSMTADGTISSAVTKKVLDRMCKEDIDPVEWVETKNLTQITDQETLSVVVDRILKENRAAVESFRQGKSKALDRLVGKVMQATHGRAKPRLVHVLLRKGLARTIDEHE